MAKGRNWDNLRNRERGQRWWAVQQREGAGARIKAETEEWAAKHRAKLARRPPIACAVECLSCGHAGNAVARLGARFYCSQCNSRRIKVTYPQAE